MVNHFHVCLCLKQSICMQLCILSRMSLEKLAAGWLTEVYVFISNVFLNVRINNNNKKIIMWDLGRGSSLPCKMLDLIYDRFLSCFFNGCLHHHPVQQDNSVPDIVRPVQYKWESTVGRHPRQWRDLLGTRRMHSKPMERELFNGFSVKDKQHELFLFILLNGFGASGTHQVSCHDFNKLGGLQHFTQMFYFNFLWFPTPF